MGDYADFLSELEHRNRDTLKLTKLSKLKKDFENSKNKLQKEREEAIKEMNHLKELRVKNKFCIMDYGQKLSLVTEVSLQRLRQFTDIEVKNQIVHKEHETPVWLLNLYENHKAEIYQS